MVRSHCVSAVNSFGYLKDTWHSPFATPAWLASTPRNWSKDAIFFHGLNLVHRSSEILFVLWLTSCSLICSFASVCVSADSLTHHLSWCRTVSMASDVLVMGHKSSCRYWKRLSPFSFSSLFPNQVGSLFTGDMTSNINLRYDDNRF